ncbi:MAG: hypothetical protein AABY00_02960 [Nanoarchaeota archaeon]
MNLKEVKKQVLIYFIVIIFFVGMLYWEKVLPYFNDLAIDKDQKAHAIAGWFVFSYFLIWIFVSQLYLDKVKNKSIVKEIIGRKKDKIKLIKELMKDTLISFTTTFIFISFTLDYPRPFLLFMGLIEINLVYAFYTFFIKDT